MKPRLPRFTAGGKGEVLRAAGSDIVRAARAGSTERLKPAWERVDYPDDWEERKKKVRIRDNYTCQAHTIGLKRCYTRRPPPFHGSLHVHHINGRSHNLNNLTTLCEDCHKAIHSHMR